MARPSLLITVPESQFKGLLDREKIVRDVKTHLQPWSDLIHDVTSYGSNLIPRCYGSSDKQLKDAVVLAVLLRQVVAMLDGIDILLANGACHAAHLQLRALFEAAVYIEWMLQGDTENKANYYYVHNLRRKLMWAKRIDPAPTESRAFVDLMDKAKIKLPDDAVRSSRAHVTEINRVLSQPRFAAITQHFDQCRGKRKHDPAWYEPLGQPSLFSIAKAVDKESQYLIVYAGASEIMHSSSYENHIKIAQEEVTFRPIRSLEDFENTFRFSTVMVFAVFLSVLAEYRSGEVPAFHRKYTEKWSSAVMSFPKIKFENTLIKI